MTDKQAFKIVLELAKKEAQRSNDYYRFEMEAHSQAMLIVEEHIDFLHMKEQKLLKIYQEVERAIDEQ